MGIQVSNRAACERFFRGRREDPWWSRPGLIGVVLLTGVLVFWRLTIDGYANPWYADGALAASRSWKALFDNAADLSGVVSLDKGPLPDWMMGLSGRILGFSPFSMLLPDALCGVASVIVLHDTVRRTLGHRAALVAALVLALSPVSVVMDRYNDPEALLALLLVASAWALVRSLESGRLRHLLLCGAFVGLAFETKMLEAYLVVPALTVAFVVAGRGGWRRRLGHLLCGGAVMVVVSLTWFATMMLIPGAARPYVGDTTDNSWFSLIFGFNGLSRLTGSGQGQPSSSGWTSLTRLFTGASGGWLLLFAFAGLLAGLWATRGAAREDRHRAAYLLFGLWGLAGFVVFSFSQGLSHPYYTNSMAPAVAALVGGGGVLMFDRLRGGRAWTWTALLAAAVATTAVVSFLLLGDSPSFVPWLRWFVLGAAGVTMAAILSLHARRRLPEQSRLWGLSRPASGRVAFTFALAAAAVTLLGGPAAYSITTLGYRQEGADPAPGPAPTGPAAAINAAVDAANPALLAYLKAHRDGARYLVAALGPQGAAPIALATGDPVMTIGGFDGATRAPTLDQLKTLIARGELRYVIPGYRGRLPAGTHWVATHCRPVTVPDDRVRMDLCARATASVQAN